MSRYIFIFILIITVVGAAYYVVYDKGVMQERLRKKDDAVVALQRELQMSRQAQKQSLRDLQAFQKQREEELLQDKEAKEHLRLQLVSLQHKVDRYDVKIARLKRERQKLISQSKHSSQLLHKQIKEKNEAIAILQQQKKSIECLRLDVPSSVADELFGVRGQKGSASTSSTSGDS